MEPSTWCVLVATVTDARIEVVEAYLADRVPEEMTSSSGPGRADWLAADQTRLASFPVPVTTASAEWASGAPGWWETSDSTTGLVAVAIPFIPSARELRLTVGEASASVAVGREAPELRLVEAPSGPQESPSVTIGWEGDLDSEVRAFVVTSDGSQPLRVNATDAGTAEVDIAGLAGPQWWLEFALTRDLRTAVEQLGPFSRAVPEAVWVVSDPGPDATVLAGLSTTFDAIVVTTEADGDDEPLDELPVRWLSDRDGELGQGLPISAKLSSGMHRIRLQRGEKVLAEASVIVVEET